MQTRHSTQSERVAELLLSFGYQLDPAVLFPVLVAEAAPFVLGNSYAFALATCLDRGTRAEIIWTLPYDLRNHFGHLDPLRIDKLAIEDIRGALSTIPRKPRYVNDAPRTIQELTRIVVGEYGGDASGIWTSRLASDVRNTFMRIHGVGPGIANMAVLLIEKAFGLRFSDVDHTRMDIKPDLHTVRVLYRLGASPTATKASAIEAARRLNPAYPGDLDGALWHIGRRWCHKIQPNCSLCPMTNLCPRVGV